ncbi:rhodanese-like domain-containing protein [Rubritalea marina]|uniref:rhodanese-like domain-containing protein n=1 Tax=Rubritalea marina TaxID=361055 RepID=UPI00036F4A2C|nr:rhodanese-like domain-containing protein [Rubritalea marina]
MKRIAFILCLTTLCGNLTLAEGIQNIEAKQAAALLQKTPSITVLDVRTVDEFANGHIEGAKLLDATKPDFKKQLEKLDRNKSYLLHCASGGRSKRALAVMKQLGFANIYHLDSGFAGWEEAKLPSAD